MMSHGRRRVLLQQLHHYLDRLFQLRIVASVHGLRIIFHFDIGRNTVILHVPGAVGIIEGQVGRAREVTVQKVFSSTCYRLRNSGINLRSSALSAEAVCTRRLTGLAAILPALPRGPAKSSWAGPKYPTVNSQKAKPMRPKIRTTNFLHAGSSLWVQGSMARLRFAYTTGHRCGSEPPSKKLCPLQESVLDNRREGGAEQECVEPYTERPVAENHHSWLRSASPILREHNIGIVRFMQAKDLRGLQGCYVWQATCNAAQPRLPR